VVASQVGVSVGSSDDSGNGDGDDGNNDSGHETQTGCTSANPNNKERK